MKKRICFHGTCTNPTTEKYCAECRKSVTQSIIVIGPPGSGKSHYVQKCMSKGDFIFDLDKIFSAISGCELYDKPENLLPFVLGLRDHIFNMIGQYDGIPKSWIILNNFYDFELEHLKKTLGAKVVELRTPASTCIERISKRCPQDLYPVELWYKYHPQPNFCSDVIID